MHNSWQVKNTIIGKLKSAIAIFWHKKTEPCELGCGILAPFAAGKNALGEKNSNYEQ